RALALSLFIVVMVSDFVFAFAGSMPIPQILFESIPSVIFPRLQEVSHLIAALAFWVFQLVLFIAIIVHLGKAIRAKAYVALIITILVVSMSIPTTYLGYNYLVKYNLAKSRIFVEEFLKHPANYDISYDDLSISTEIGS